nr:unnamed protein product [Callosobruchus chinensis]
MPPTGSTSSLSTFPLPPAPWSLTRDLQIPHRISCSTSYAISSPSHTLNISDSTTCASGGTTEWGNSCGEIVCFGSEDQMRLGGDLLQFTH